MIFVVAISNKATSPTVIFSSKNCKQSDNTLQPPLLILRIFHRHQRLSFHEKDSKKTSSRNSLVSLDQFPGANDYDLEWSFDLLGK